MQNFNRNRGGDRFGKRKFGGRDRDGERPEMHHAVCAECGNDCEVPFRPSGDKPVYCSDCFSKQHDERGGSRDFDRRDGGRRDGGRREFGGRDGGRDSGRRDMHQATCTACGQTCEVPFRPTGDKAIYCDACFGKIGKGGAKKGENYGEQFNALNAKLDKLIRFLMPKEAAPAKEEKVAEKKPAKKTAEKKAEVKEEKKEDKKEDKKKVAKKKTAKKK